MNVRFFITYRENMKNQKNLSICCKAKMKIWSSNEGTCSGYCSNCEQPFVSQICPMGKERTHNWKLDTTKDKDYTYCLKCSNIMPN